MNWKKITPAEANALMARNEKDWMTDAVELHRRYSYWHRFVSVLSYIWYRDPFFSVHSTGIGDVFRFTCFCGQRCRVADWESW